MRAEDRAPEFDTPTADTYDEQDFVITVNKGSLTIRPTPGELPNPSLVVDSSAFSQDFYVEGDYIGPFSSAGAWSLTWNSADPGGFALDPLDDTTARLWKTGDTTAGDYRFTLTAVDDNCSDNTASAVYTIQITDSGVGGPFTADLEAEWRFDECDAWDGASYDIVDALGDANHYGKAAGGGPGRARRQGLPGRLVRRGGRQDRQPGCSPATTSCSSATRSPWPAGSSPRAEAATTRG